MERFSNFRDSYTGVHSFFVPTVNTGIVNFIRYSLLGFFIACLRFPLIAVFWLLFSFFSSISIVIPVFALQRAFSRFIHVIFCRILLWLSGIFWINSSNANTPRKQRIANLNAPTHGDIVVANYSGYLDILFLAQKYTPQFVFLPTEDGDKKNSVDCSVVPLSTVSALLHTIWNTHFSQSQAVPLSSVLESSRNRKSGPVVVFPELTCSNGVSLLPPASLWGVPIKTRVFGHVTKYPNHFNPCFCHMTSFFAHFWGLLSQIYTSMACVSISPDRLPPMFRLSPEDARTGTVIQPPKQLAKGPMADTWIQDVFGVLAQASGKQVAKSGLALKDHMIRFFFYGGEKGDKEW
eukprot:GCRY01007635.1.p1 GENE.GCRY01007635.1~~GCRY01007635.1.p1  ORF type:complete len:349 (-),score=37.34 GCRY01007635.1:58-1104(-)